jgi:hypothetical protein
MVFLCDGISVADFIDDGMERNFNAIVKNVGKIATKSAKLAPKSSMFPQMSRKIFSSTIYMLPSMLLCCYGLCCYSTNFRKMTCQIDAKSPQICRQIVLSPNRQV